MPLVSSPNFLLLSSLYAIGSLMRLHIREYSSSTICLVVRSLFFSNHQKSMMSQSRYFVAGRFSLLSDQCFDRLECIAFMRARLYGPLVCLPKPFRDGCPCTLQTSHKSCCSQLLNSILCETSIHAFAHVYLHSYLALYSMVF